ncbi:hypothetical protein CcCBS67573_g09932 [Chytriomyces confervae]|uniref:RNase H type-1 domain-containing protein n=1 Tax=Chytriomyces confervae TaxID=246404 RepID=A0A507DKA2_9FUNG|nr:hypothetical protein CcCBS67573_g09932 [Chytriomyces confervae]
MADQPPTRATAWVLSAQYNALSDDMIAAIAALMEVNEPTRDTGFFYLRTHLVVPADVHADDAEDINALIALDVGNVPPPVPRVRCFAAAGREAAVIAAQLRMLPPPPPPPPADQPAANEPEPPATEPQQTAAAAHQKRPRGDDDSLQGRYNLLSLHFKAGLGTGDHKTHDAMENAMRAIHDTASALRDFDRLDTWAYAIALAQECKQAGLSTHATARRLADQLGESHSNFAVSSSTSKSICEESASELKHAKALSDKSDRSDKRSRTTPHGRPGNGPSGSSGSGSRSRNGCAHCKRADIPTHTEADCKSWSPPQFTSEFLAYNTISTAYVPPSPSIEEVLAGANGDPADLFLKSPDHFRAGAVNRDVLEAWRDVAAYSPQGAQILSWVEHSVNVEDFWAGPGRPAHTVIRNHTNITPDLNKFLDEALEADLASGASILLGPCESTPPPFLVYPIGIEPTKPRRIGDARYLNSFTKAPLHHPETLRHLTRWIGRFMSVADIKACYYNFRLHPDSWKYFGFRWKRQGVWCWFISTVLIFGWNVAAYVCFVMTGAIVARLRAYNIPCMVFYDDFAMGQLAGRAPLQGAQSATYILLALGEKLGLYFGRKSQITPTSSPVYLGFQIHLCERRLEITDKKRETFLALLHSFVHAAQVPFSTLERFTGKCAHLSFALQGGLAFTRRQYSALATGQCGKSIHITAPLRQELQEWLMVDTSSPDHWAGAEWLSPEHASVHINTRLETDANNHRIGGALIVNGQTTLMGEEVPDHLLPGEGVSINVREAYALLAAICQFAPHLKNKWVDVWLDSMVVVICLEHGSSKQLLINDILVLVWRLTRQINCRLVVHHFSSESNATADGITREDPRNDFRLADTCFELLERLHGPFSLDAMASSTNTKCARFYSRYACKGALAQNTLSMRLDASENAYVFPPFAMVSAVVQHFLHQACAFTIVVPELPEIWWVQLQHRAPNPTLLGAKGSSDTILGYMTVNEDYITKRASTLAGSSPSLPKPVTDEMSRLASFLESRTAKPPILPRSASPLDVVEFLIHKELNSRTQYHGITCNLAGTAKVGNRLNKRCDPLVCQIRAAAASIRTASSHIRTGYADLGPTGPWDPSTGRGNPGDSRLVSTHVDRLAKESGDSLVLPLQSTPLPVSFTRLLEADIYAKISDPSLPPMIRLQWRQLWCFTLLVGISGRRPGDLTRIRTPSVIWLPDRTRVVITLINGKTATASKPDRFVVDHPAFLTSLKLYARDCAWNGLSLSEGTPYVFFKMAEHKSPDKNAPGSAQNLNAAFQRTLKGMGIFEGETLYGFRVGNAVTTALNTSDPATLRAAGGWHSDESALRYSQFAIVATAAEAGAAHPADAARSWLAQRKELAFFI